jgi:hypothetical protein
MVGYSKPRTYAPLLTRSEHKPAPQPQPQPHPEPPKDDKDGYKPPVDQPKKEEVPAPAPKLEMEKYVFDEEVTLKCEGGHIVITGKRH